MSKTYFDIVDSYKASGGLLIAWWNADRRREKGLLPARVLTHSDPRCPFVHSNEGPPLTMPADSCPGRCGREIPLHEVPTTSALLCCRTPTKRHMEVETERTSACLRITQNSRCYLDNLLILILGVDLNQRPLGYESLNYCN